MITIERRQILKVLGALPLTALLSRSKLAESATANTIEIDISAFDRALLPREHGQLATLTRPIFRRYPSRDHCMQMAAFFNEREGMLVIGNDPKAGICDWQILPRNKLRLLFYGAAPEIIVKKIEPTIEAAATSYREWAIHQSWAIKQTRPRLNLNFITVASSSSIAVERAYLERVAKTIQVPFGAWFTQWRKYPFDRMYPNYEAKEKTEFPKLLNKLMKSGVVCFPYINGLLWDSNLGSFNETSKKTALLTKDLRAAAYNRELSFLNYACPFSLKWRDTISNVFKSVNDSDGKACNGIYLDMLAAAEPMICMASNHGHEPGDPYAWTMGIRQLLEMIDAKIMVEGCAEVYLDRVDYMLMHLHTSQPDMAPLWNLVYGDLSRPVGWQLPANIERTDFDQIVKKSIGFGVRTMASPWITSEPEARVFNRLMKNEPGTPPHFRVNDAIPE